MLKGPKLIILCNQYFAKPKRSLYNWSTVHLIFEKEIPNFDHQLREVRSLSGVVGPAAGHK